MAEGFKENSEFFTLTYETPVAINHNLAFARIAPLLWMRAGSQGRRIDILPVRGWDVADTYGLLTDLDKTVPFCKAVEKSDTLCIVYIVTHPQVYRRIEAIAKVGDKYRVLDLTSATVRKALAEAKDANSLYAGAFASDY
jgi:adenine-specific DNA-methyltransferase